MGKQVVGKRFAEFKPAELGRIAGISPEVQRVWRARGHIPKSDTPHARYGVLLVAALMVRKALSHLGVSHSELNALSYDAARHVTWWAISLSSAEPRVFLASEQAPTPEAAAEFYAAAVDQELGINAKTVNRFVVKVEDQPIMAARETTILFEGKEAGFFVDLAAIGRNLADRAAQPLFELVIADARAERDQT